MPPGYPEEAPYSGSACSLQPVVNHERCHTCIFYTDLCYRGMSCLTSHPISHLRLWMQHFPVPLAALIHIPCLPAQRDHLHLEEMKVLYQSSKTVDDAILLQLLACQQNFQELKKPILK